MLSSAVRPFVRAVWILALAVVCLALTSSSAFAANAKIEKEAKALDKKAMDTDYLGTDFASAQDHLNQAISKCGTDKCTAATRAILRRDLGVVLVGGKVDRARGVQSFQDAMAIDGKVDLDPDTKTQEIEAAWNQAKGGPATAPTVKPQAPVGGDFKHTPPSEGQTNTPLPLYVETTAGSDKVVKVVVKYKGFGMTDYRALVLGPVTPGFGAVVPCADVQEGAFSYFIQGFDADNNPIASAGDPNHPFVVAVKKTFEGDPPHLPGQTAPAQCVSAADCPPDFPGCKSTSSEEKKKDGAACVSNDECASNSCSNDKCVGDGDEGEDSFARVWVGLEMTYDLMSLASTNDVCAIDTNDKSTDPNSGLPLNDKGYNCVDSGADYPSRSDITKAQALQLGVADRVAGGFAPGNFRIMLAADVALTSHILLGGRLGYVANTYPGSAASEFAPVHLEARATGVVGPHGIARAGFMGYGYIAGGVAPADAKVSVNVVETGFGSKTVDAWRVTGPGFFALGLGARVQFTKKTALQIGPRVAFFGGGGGVVPVIGPDLSFQIGF